jgi:hypothetical protein
MWLVSSILGLLLLSAWIQKGSRLILGSAAPIRSLSSHRTVLARVSRLACIKHAILTSIPLPVILLVVSSFLALILHHWLSWVLHLFGYLLTVSLTYITMFPLLVIATLLTLASTAASTGLLIPLYAWPGIDGWNTIYDSIAAHPAIPFYLIINPSTGPGTTEYPEDVFITAIDKLNSYSNTKILGYTYTRQGTRASSDVEKDIATYANWATYAGQNISLSGIFFDEASNGSDPSKLAYFQKLSRKYKSSSLGTVVFNPGVKLVADVAEWFAAADFIVEYENTYANWVARAPDEHFSTSDHYGKDAVILNQTPVDADVDNVVRLAKDIGLGAIYLASDDNCMSLGTVSKVAVAVAQSRNARRRGHGR